MSAEGPLGPRGHGRPRRPDGQPVGVAGAALEHPSGRSHPPGERDGDGAGDGAQTRPRDGAQPPEPGDRDGDGDGRRSSAEVRREGRALRPHARPVPETAAARLVISLVGLGSLAAGSVAFALDAHRLRLAALLVFCLVGIGSAPWQATTALRLPARLTLTMLTSLAVLTLGSVAMLAQGRWDPGLAFGIVAAVCVPLHLRGLRLALRPEERARRADAPDLPRGGPVHNRRDWLRTRAAGSLPLVATGVGAALCLHAALVHRSIEPGFFGFLTHIGATWYVGLALLLAAVTLPPAGREHRIAVPVLAVVLVLTLTPALVYDGPRAQSAGKHIDLVMQIRAHHRMDSAVDVYEKWPGFFGATAWLSDVAGVRDPLRLATFWPPLLALFRVASLRYLFGQVLRSPHQAWMAVTLAVLADPLGADYFSPQSVGFVVGVAVFALALSTAAEVPRLPLIFVAGWVLAASHQLTPYMVAGALVVLVVLRQLRPWWTPLLVLGPALLWMGVNRHALRGFVSWDAIGGTENFRPPPTFAAPGFERLPVVRQTVVALAVGIVVVGCLALVAVLRRRRDGRLWAFASCPAAGVGLVVINPYGQEGIFRAALFAVPWLALVAAHVFPSLPERHRRGLFVGATAALAGTFLVASFGLDGSNVVRPADVAAYRYVQQQSVGRPVPSFVLDLGGGDLPSPLPPEARTFQSVDREDLEIPQTGPVVVDPDRQVEQLTEYFLRYTRQNAAGAELYALWSPATAYHDWAYGLQAPDQFAALRDAFRRSPYWDVALRRDGTDLFRFRSTYHDGEAGLR